MNKLRHWASRLSLGLFLGLGLALLTSCSETIDLSKEAQAENDKLFGEYAQNKEYEKVQLKGDYADRFVYMKWTHRAEDRSRKPKATDYVRMKYEGRVLREKYIFDQKDAASIRLLPQFKVSGLVPGVSIALQNMALGDKATVVMPWFLGYGARGSAHIPGFSALSFEMELLEISSSAN